MKKTDKLSLVNLIPIILLIVSACNNNENKGGKDIDTLPDRYDYPGGDRSNQEPLHTDSTGRSDTVKTGFGK